jgi:hypothetical protein
VLAESAKLISAGNSVVLSIGDKQHLFNIARLSKSFTFGYIKAKFGNSYPKMNADGTRLMVRQDGSHTATAR